MNLYVTSYLDSSRTVHSMRVLLKGVLNVLMVKSKGSGYVQKEGDVILNWGSDTEQTKKYRVDSIKKKTPMLNPPEIVSFLKDRLGFYEFLREEGVNVPRFGYKKAEIIDWGPKANLMMRSKTKTEEGEDIVLNKTVDFQNYRASTKFFVEYTPKAFEYRVSVQDAKRGSSIFLIEVKDLIPKDEEGKVVQEEFLDWRIRTRQNGFRYNKAVSAEVPDSVREVARQAYEAMKTKFKDDLVFCSYEIIYSVKDDKAYVIDATTHPVLEDKASIESFSGVLAKLGK